MQDAIITSSWLNVLNAATATNSAPTVVTDGVALPINRRGKTVVVRFRQSATSGARTYTVKLWGYCAGEHTAADAVIAATAGWVDLEEEVSQASVSADGSFARVFECITVFSRIYAEITAITGTATKVSVALALTEE